MRYYTLRLLHFQIKAQERAAQLAEVERLHAVLTPAESIPPKAVSVNVPMPLSFWNGWAWQEECVSSATAKPRLLAAMNEAGVKATRELVQKIALKLPNDELRTAASTLLQDIETLSKQEPRKRTPRKRKRWKKATRQPLSNAAQGSLHDKVRAPHRPGGKMMRHPVWSLDEPPLGGWDLGTHVIERQEPVDVDAMESKLDAILSEQSEEPAADEAKLDEFLATSDDEEPAIGLEARLEAVLAWEPKPVSRRRKKRQPITPPKPQLPPVVLCRRVLPWIKTRALTKPTLRCSRPA